MYCRSGIFHGSWSWLSSFPRRLGFIPNSRAIWTWACDRPCRLRASIHACIVGFNFGFNFFFLVFIPLLETVLAVEEPTIVAVVCFYAAMLTASWVGSGPFSLKGFTAA